MANLTENTERMLKLAEIARWVIEEAENRKADPVAFNPHGAIAWNEIALKINEADLGYKESVTMQLDFADALRIARQQLSNEKIARKNRTQMEWIDYTLEGGPICQKIIGKECEIHLQRRPPYCNRGNWLATISATHGSDLARSMDAHDLWPRYYFDPERAKLEIEAWLIKRKQAII